MLESILRRDIVNLRAVPDQGVKEAIDIISKPRDNFFGFRIEDDFFLGWKCHINYSISSIDGKKDYNESMDIH